MSALIPRISALAFMSNLPSSKHIRLRFRRYPLVNIYTGNRIITYMDLVFAVTMLMIKIENSFFQADLPIDNVCTYLSGQI